MWIDPLVFFDEGSYVLRRHVVHANLYDRQRWEWTYNVTPRMCSIIWDTIEPEQNIPGNPLPKHLLWALMFMNLYLTETIITALAKADPKTFRKWTWLFIEAIDAKTHDVIRFERRLENRQGNVCTISVDGVDFLILEQFHTCMWNNKKRWEGYYTKITAIILEQFRLVLPKRSVLLLEIKPTPIENALASAVSIGFVTVDEEAGNLSFAFDVPYINIFALIQSNRNRMVIMGSIFVFTIKDLLRT